MKTDGWTMCWIWLTVICTIVVLTWLLVIAFGGDKPAASKRVDVNSGADVLA